MTQTTLNCFWDFWDSN